MPKLPKYKTIFKLSQLPSLLVACVGGSVLYSFQFFGLVSAPF